MAQIVRRDLVDVIIEPIGKQQVAMAAPGGFRCQCGVVIGEVVERYGKLP